MSKYTPEACARAGIPYCQQKEREWYMRIADAYDEGCYLAEPATARFSRSYTRMAQKDGGVEGWQKHPSELATIAEWRSYWRSLPDYDGPPMRAPSGVGYWTHREITPFEHAAAAELGITQEPDDARKDEHGNLILARWVTENLFAVIADLRFALPSAGGRGWCPKLAGVNE